MSFETVSEESRPFRKTASSSNFTFRFKITANLPLTCRTPGNQPHSGVEASSDQYLSQKTA